MDTSKQKPDLMGKPGASADGIKRILAHLEHGANLPASKPTRAGGWTIDGWTLGLGMMLLGMCCVAWLLHGDGGRAGGFRQGYGSSASHYQDRQPKTMVERASMASAHGNLNGTTPGTIAEQPAAIINDPAAQTDAGLNARMRAARDAANNSAAASQGAASTGIRNHANAPAARTPAASTYASARSKTPPASDTDVVLLTALVAHAGKPAVVAPERSRDIVERYDGDNTAELLERCNQLGVIEGMLCRSRICSGRWDSDPVCRAPAQ